MNTKRLINYLDKAYWQIANTCGWKESDNNRAIKAQVNILKAMKIILDNETDFGSGPIPKPAWFDSEYKEYVKGE